MEAEASNKPTTSFWVISGVALLWNLMGGYQYIWSVTLSDSALAAMPAAEAALYSATPVWVTSAFAIAVFGGIFGCVGLLIRKKWAKPLFVASVVGAVIQFTYWLFMTDVIELYGITSAVMPILVILVCIYLVRFSGSAMKQGWLS